MGELEVQRTQQRPSQGVLQEPSRGAVPRQLEQARRPSVGALAVPWTRPESAVGGQEGHPQGEMSAAEGGRRSVHGQRQPEEPWWRMTAPPQVEAQMAAEEQAGVGQWGWWVGAGPSRAQGADW